MSETSEESIENITKRIEFLVGSKQKEIMQLQARGVVLNQEIRRLRAGLVGLQGKPPGKAGPTKVTKWVPERRAKFAATKAAQSDRPAAPAASEQGG